MSRTLLLKPISWAFLLSILVGSTAQADIIVLPAGNAIQWNKKMELKRKAGGFDTIDRGRVVTVSPKMLTFHGGRFDVDIGTQREGKCYFSFGVSTPDAKHRFNGSDMVCYNFWNNDESAGNNNSMGLIIRGDVWDSVNQATVPAEMILWPKREDRIRMIIDSPAAGGKREWELDIDEGS